MLGKPLQNWSFPREEGRQRKMRSCLVHDLNRPRICLQWYQIASAVARLWMPCVEASIAVGEQETTNRIYSENELHFCHISIVSQLHRHCEHLVTHFGFVVDDSERYVICAEVMVILSLHDHAMHVAQPTRSTLKPARNDEATVALLPCRHTAPQQTNDP